jgi:tRNA threonylcarbamoyladenosine biosynthesis protein TsaB
MWVLAIETATDGASLALLRERRVIADVTLAAERGLAEQVLPALDALLGLVGLSPPDLGACAISIGPGSFTGIRVGLATLQGLAFGAAPAIGPVAALLDARREEVYAAVYRDAEAVLDVPLVPEGVYGIGVLADLLPPDCLLVGQGALLHQRQLEATRSGLRFASAAHAAARARDVGALGIRLIESHAGMDPGLLQPHYLRRAEAEARRTGQALEA